MKKIALIAGALLALSASAALAQTPGINLSWDDCGTFGTVNKTFACNSNSGAGFSMVASFEPPAGIDNMVGIASQIDITTDASTLPDWWGHGTGCRGAAALAVSFDFTASTLNCMDFYAGQAAGGYAYDVGFGSPARARFRIQGAVPDNLQGPVDPASEWYGFKATINRTKTIGTGACAGCTNPACIVLNSIQLFQPAQFNHDPEIDNPKDRNFVTWQSPPTGPVGCPLSTPNTKTTWGSLKSLYR